MATDTSAMRFRVHGRVQGVGFRAATQRKAAGLGLAGWVRNRGDGSVEGLAGGPQEALEAFRRWLAEGPPAAQVTALDWQAATEPVSPGFFVRP